MGVVAVNVNLAAENDGEAYADLADRRQRIAGREAAYFAEAPGALDIRRIQMREDLITSRFNDRRFGITHLGTFSNVASGAIDLPSTWTCSFPQRAATLWRA